MRIDHVVYAVSDLAGAMDRLDAEHGLAAIAGGEHPSMGTANAIAPLPPVYLELLSPVDTANPVAALIAERIAGGDRPFAWCVATEDMDATAARLGLTPIDASRTKPDGTELRWRLAGLLESVAEPSLPFFIEWAPGTAHPSEDGPGSGTLERVDLTGDAGRLRDWLAGADLPYRIEPGEPAVRALHLRTERGDAVLA